MKAQYYLLIDADSDTESCLTCYDDGVRETFDTEAEAIEAAKTYTGVSRVLKGVANVSQRHSYKVEKLK